MRPFLVLKYNQYFFNFLLTFISWTFASIKDSLIAVTQPEPSRSIPPRSTNTPLFKIPFSFAIPANNLATVVFALPGFPPNIIVLFGHVGFDGEEKLVDVSLMVATSISNNNAYKRTVNNDDNNSNH